MNFHKNCIERRRFQGNPVQHWGGPATVSGSLSREPENLKTLLDGVRGHIPHPCKQGNPAGFPCVFSEEGLRS